MADLTEIRETVRERYAAAAKRAGKQDDGGCCGGSVACTPADETGVFGGALYDQATADGVPESAVNASS